MPGDFLRATLLPSILSGILIWGWPRKWTDRPCYPLPEESKRQSRTALIVLVVTFALVIVLIAVSPGAYGDSKQRDYSFTDVVGQAVAWGVILLPMFVGIKADGLEWRELQYRRTNLLSSLMLSRATLFKQPKARINEQMNTKKEALSGLSRSGSTAGYKYSSANRRMACH